MREIECYQQSYISRCQKQIENRGGGECKLVRILTRPLSPKEGQTILASPQNPYLVGEEEGFPPPLQPPVISMYSTSPVIDHIFGM